MWLLFSGEPQTQAVCGSLIYRYFSYRWSQTQVLLYVAVIDRQPVSIQVATNTGFTVCGCYIQAGFLHRWPLTQVLLYVAVIYRLAYLHRWPLTQVLLYVTVIYRLGNVSTQVVTNTGFTVCGCYIVQVGCSIQVATNTGFTVCGCYITGWLFYTGGH